MLQKEIMFYNHKQEIEILRMDEVIMLVLDILPDDHYLHMPQQVLCLLMFYNHKQGTGILRMDEVIIELWDILLENQILYMLQVLLMG